MALTLGVLLAACLTGSFFDVKARRIPNWLTGSLAVAALGINAFYGWRQLAVSAAVMAVLLVLGGLLYSRGGIGGGDVKLAAAASGLLGFPMCVPFLLYTAIGGGLLAIAFVLSRGTLRESTARLAVMTTTGSGGVTPDKAQTLPYAVAFAFGAVMIALSQTVAPFLRILT